MGVIFRSRLSKTLIASMAERVLDFLRTDFLINKPSQVKWLISILTSEWRKLPQSECIATVEYLKQHLLTRLNRLGPISS